MARCRSTISPTGPQRTDRSGSRPACGAGRTHPCADQRAGITLGAGSCSTQGNWQWLKLPKEAIAPPGLGGELRKLDRLNSRISTRSMVGVYPNYATAYAAWRGQGAADRRQRGDALFHRSSAPAARSRAPGADRRADRAFPMRSLRRITRSYRVQRAIGVDCRALPALVWQRRESPSSRRTRSSGSSNRCRSFWRCGTGSIS